MKNTCENVKDLQEKGGVFTCTGALAHSAPVHAFMTDTQ